MADVLIVDDNPDIAECLEALLALEGHRVRTAAHGEEGLLQLTGRLPDLVILDVDMPVLDGPGMVLRMFIEDCGKERIPILLISAGARLAEVAERVGTPYYLTKPFDPSEVSALVAHVCEERITPRPAGDLP